VVYGSGDPEEPAKPGWPDRVFSLNEYWNGEAFEARVNWKLIFEEGESLTSVPTVFAEVAYFTSEVAGSGFCETGDGRLWGVKFDDTNASDADVIGKLDLDGCPITTDDIGKFLELPDSDVFGVQLVQRPTCFENPGNYTPWTGVTTGATVPPIGAGYPGVAQASPGPTFSGSSQGGIELVVQTGETGMSSPEMTPPAGGGQVQTGNKVVQKVPQPPQTVFSSSWGMVFD
jgi:hypothetical protein